MNSRLGKILIVFVLSLALAIIIIDTTLLNVSLATIIRDLNTDIQSIQWVITAYSLTLAALTITGGRIGDLFGRKKMFVTGAIIFALGSFIASISTNVPMMIVGESIIEGIGAALMMPATASLLVANFKGKARALAFGIWGGVAGAAAALGPLLGGYLATNYSWRWGFRINVFVAALLVVGSYIIPDSYDTEEKPILDWGGVFLSALGLLAFVFGVIESSVYGWWKSSVPFSIGGYTFTFLGDYSIVPFAIGIGIVLLAGFLLWEAHMDKKGLTPLVSLRLFQNRQFTSGVATTAIITLGQTGIIFTLPIFFQSVKGYSAYQTGIALLPMSITMLIMSPLGAFLSSRFRPKLLIHIGLLMNVVGMLLMRNSLTLQATTESVALGLMFCGAGMGLVMSQISNMTLSAVSVQEAGEASGVNNTFRQVGSTFGSAIIGAVLLGALASSLTNGIQQSAVIPSSLKSQIVSVISHQTSNVEFGNDSQISRSFSPEITQEVITISHKATIDSNKVALLISSLFAFFGFLISFTLPNVQDVERERSVAAGH